MCGKQQAAGLLSLISLISFGYSLRSIHFIVSLKNSFFPRMGCYFFSLPYRNQIKPHLCNRPFSDYVSYMALILLELCHR